MNILVILVPLALALGGFFLWSFLIATRSGQFDDLKSPKFKILDDENTKKGEK